MSWIWLKVEYRKVNVVSEIDDSVMPLTGSWAILRLERAIVSEYCICNILILKIILIIL